MHLFSGHKKTHSWSIVYEQVSGQVWSRPVPTTPILILIINATQLSCEINCFWCSIQPCLLTNSTIFILVLYLIWQLIARSLKHAGSLNGRLNIYLSIMVGRVAVFSLLITKETTMIVIYVIITFIRWWMEFKTFATIKNVLKWNPPFLGVNIFSVFHYWTVLCSQNVRLLAISDSFCSYGNQESHHPTVWHIFKIFISKN